MERRLILVAVLLVIVFVLIGIGMLSLRNGSDNQYDNSITIENNNSETNNTLREENNTTTISEESTITREFSSLNVAKGEEISVIFYIHKANDESYYFIEEYAPEGWTVTDSAKGETNNPNRLAWYSLGTFGSSGDASLTYKIKAPSISGIYEFNGTYLLEGMDKEEEIKGDTTITVA